MGRKVDIHANVDVYHVADVLIVLKMISEVISENDNSWKEQFFHAQYTHTSNPIT